VRSTNDNNGPYEMSLEDLLSRDELQGYPTLEVLQGIQEIWRYHGPDIFFLKPYEMKTYINDLKQVKDGSYIKYTLSEIEMEIKSQNIRFTNFKQLDEDVDAVFKKHKEKIGANGYISLEADLFYNDEKLKDYTKQQLNASMSRRGEGIDGNKQVEIGYQWGSCNRVWRKFE
jgi:hypothetical protein